MIDPLAGIIAGKVIDFLVKNFAGMKIDEWLSDQDKKKAFKKALEASLDLVADEGFSIKGPGALDDSFLTSEVVKEELWAKLLDPSIDEEINYVILEEELRAIYQGVPISDREVEAIEFLVDALMDEMWRQASLRDLIYGKILYQHDRRLSLKRKKTLVLDYLKVEGKRIEDQLDEDLGEGNRYVEPLIEKKTKKTEYEKATYKPPGEEEDSFAPVDPNTYFTEGPEDKVVVVADSGYGKTTLLKALFLRISKSFEAKPFGTHSFIPIFLTPSQAAECSETNIENKVKIRLMVSGCREGKVRQFVQDEFGKGNFIFLIDALDQVVNRENLRGALSGSAFGKNRVVITVRPNVWKMEEGHLSGYACVRLREFNQNRWEEYLGRERLAALREVVDQDFLSVPILLRLIVEYWLRGTKKTERVKNRAGLYSNMFNRLLERPEDRDAVEALTKDPRNPIDVRDDLRKLAHDALAQGYLGQLPRSYAKKILGENKLKDLEARRGILRILETVEEIAFRHRSFQEYLAAEYLKSNIKRKDDLNRLETYLYHPNWEESMRFLVGLIDPESAEYVVDRMLSVAERRLLFLYRDHLRIASLCLREMGKTGENQLVTIIKALRKDLRDPVLQDTAISILSTLKDKQAVEILNSLLTQGDSSVRKRATDALAKIGSEKAAEALIQALQDKDASVRWRATYALGKIGSRKTVEGLIQALQDKDASVRWSAAYALGEIISEKAAEALIQALQDKDASVRGSVADALGKIGSRKAVEDLIQALQDKDASVRWSAAVALGKIGSEKAVEGLIQALQNEDASVQGSAVDALGKIRSEKAVEGLIQALQNKVASVRRSAADALGEIRSEKAVEGLIQALQNKVASVRERATYALGKIGSEKSVECLIQALQDKDASVRWSAVDTLGKIGSEKAVEALIQALQDKDALVQWRAAGTLGEIGSEKAVEALTQALQHGDDSLRRRTTGALGDIRSEKAVEALIQALQDKDASVRRSAADALGKIKSEKVVEALIQALHNKDASVRRSAADALGKIKSEKAVEGLIQALQDKDASVRWSTADALGKIGSEKAVENLIQALQDEDASVRGNAADALGKIESEKAVEALIQTLRDKNTSVRDSVVDALGKIRSEKAEKALIQALHHEDASVRRSATDALGEIRSEKAVEALIQALEHGDDSVRRSAVDALGEIGSEKAVENLIQTLQHGDASIRWNAAVALGKIRSEKAVENLIQALQDKDASVRGSVAENLAAFDVSSIQSALVDMWQGENPSVNRLLLLEGIRTYDRIIRNREPL